MLPNENVTRVLKALYPLGAMLTLVPMVDWFAKAYPFFPSLVPWRFGALVALVPQLAIMLTGFAIVVAIAAFVGHRSFLKVLSGLSAVGTLLALVVLVLFVLDTLQMRLDITDPNTRAGMTKALVSGTMTSIFAVIVLASITMGAWRASAFVARDGRAQRADGKARGVRPVAGVRADDAVLTSSPNVITSSGSGR